MATDLRPGIHRRPRDDAVRPSPAGTRLAHRRRRALLLHRRGPATVRVRGASDDQLSVRRHPIRLPALSPVRGRRGRGPRRHLALGHDAVTARHGGRGVRRGHVLGGFGGSPIATPCPARGGLLRDAHGPHRPPDVRRGPDPRDRSAAGPPGHMAGPADVSARPLPEHRRHRPLRRTGAARTPGDRTLRRRGARVGPRDPLAH